MLFNHIGQPGAVNPGRKDKTMKASIIERIKKADGRDVVIGRYTYRFDHVFGQIVRAKTSERGLEWLYSDGRRVGPWKVVHEF